jgi:hypothetical protein
LAETLSPSTFNAPVIQPHAAEVRFYRGLLELTREEAETQLLQSLLRELRLDPEEQRRAILGRFRAWLDLSVEDGARIAAAYDGAHDELTPEQQIAIDEAERDVVLGGLSYREYERLSEFLPWLRAWNVPTVTRRPFTGPPAPFSLALSLSRN